MRRTIDRDARGAVRRPAPWLWLALALLAASLAACARNPVTGRREAVLQTERGEIEQGDAAAAEVAAQIGLLEEPELRAYIDALGQRLAKQSPRTQLVHRFEIVMMQEPNAFALPGGHIYVSRGLLELVDSEDELATVIGHEIGHVAARHSVARQTANAPLAPVRILAGIGGAATSIVAPGVGSLVTGLGQLPGALALAAYSREQEREADRLGQQYAAATGFDPSALAKFMETLTREEAMAGADPNRRSFFASHPRSPERSRDAVEFAKTLTIAVVTPPALERAAFLERLDGMLVGASAAEGVFIEERFLHADLGVGLSFPKQWETLNAPQAVAAIQKERLGQVIVQLVAEGADPMETALAFDKEIRLATAPRRLQINGLSAAQAEAELSQNGERLRVLITWVAHRERIYQIAGMASRRNFESLRATLSEVALSFHELDDAERAEVKQDRLRIATARAGETLAELGERTGNRWSVERTALANALEPDAKLAAGALVKIAVAEPFVGRDPAASGGGETAAKKEAPAKK